MKKLFKLFAYICAAAACVAFAGCGMLACPSPLKDVISYCRLHEDCNFKLPVKVTRGRHADPEYQRFGTDATLEEIKTNVESLNKKGESYSAEIYADRFLFIEENTDGGKVHYYLLTKLTDAENTYHLRCPAYGLKASEEEEYGASELIYLPAHLLQIQASKYEFIFDVVAGCKYKLNCERRNVEDFYRRIKEFEVTDTQSGITVKTCDEISEKKLCKNFELNFSTEEDGVYVHFEKL